MGYPDYDPNRKMTKYERKALNQKLRILYLIKGLKDYEKNDPVILERLQFC